MKISPGKLAVKLYMAIVFASFGVFPLFDRTLTGNIFGIWLLCALMWYLIACLALRYGGGFLEFLKRKSVKIDAFLDKRVSGKRLFFASFLVIVLIWLRAYLALFPGTLGYDAPLQLYQWEGFDALSDHHPVAHTFFLGVIYDLGSEIFGTANGGIALYTAIQGLIVALCAAYGIYYLKKRGASGLFVILSLVWVAFNPFLQSLSFNATKDTLFGAFMLLFVLKFHELISTENPGTAEIAWTAVSALLMCLFRHQGIYVLVLMLLFILIAPAGKMGMKKAKVSLTVLCVALFTWGFGFLCHNVFDIEAGNSREMLSVPIQQMAYVCRLKLDGADVDISEEELGTIKSFLGESGITGFEKDSADPSKSAFNTEAFMADFSNNIKTYINVGLKNKWEYLVAFKNLTAGYFKASELNYAGLMFFNPFTEIHDFGVTRHSFDNGYLEFLKYTAGQAGYRDIPILAIVLSPTLVIRLIPALFGLALYRKDYRLWLAVLPMLLYAASLFLGPVALVRYLYPLIMVTPFAVFLFKGESAPADVKENNE